MKPNQQRFILTVVRILFAIYIILLAYFCFFSEHFGRNLSSEYRYNLVLFKELKRFVTYRKEVGIESFIVNIIGNVLAFTPFGFALPIISPRNRKFLSIVFLSFEFSLAIELIQIIFKVGIFDVDDLFLNTLGGMFGGICFFLCSGIFGVMRRKAKG